MTRSSGLRDPAKAVAVGKCLLRRQFGFKGLGLDITHPATCPYCSVAPEVLLAALDEFNDWAGFTREDLHDPYNPTMHEIRPAIDHFVRLPMEEQQALVQAAQQV
jgi:hypothetical protein